MLNKLVCIEHEACGACLSAAAHCRWCADPYFSSKVPRCNDDERWVNSGVMWHLHSVCASEHVCWCTDLYSSSKVRWCNDDERWVRSRRRRHWPCCMLRQVPATICSGAPTLYFRKKTWRSLRVSNTWLCRRDEQYIEIKTFWSSRKDRVILITIYLSIHLVVKRWCLSIVPNAVYIVRWSYQANRLEIPTGLPY